MILTVENLSFIWSTAFQLLFKITIRDIKRQYVERDLKPYACAYKSYISLKTRKSKAEFQWKTVLFIDEYKFNLKLFKE